MTTLRRTVTTRLDADRTFAYLADFANAEEWDSGTVSCTRTSGDGGVGTVYHNVSTFAGRTVELDYTVTELERLRIVLVGENDTTTSTDTIVVRPATDGSVVEYTAEFTFRGPARFLGPLLKPLLDNLGDRTAEQLEASLDAKVGTA